MNTWANTVLTDKGRSLMAKLTQGNTLNITKAVAGDNFVTPGLLSQQTTISNQKQVLTFRPVAYPETGKCAITVSLKNEGLAAGYTATQVGMFATDPDEGEVLLFVSQATDAESGTIIPSETEMPGYSAEWTFYLKYAQADGVTVTVDPSNSVTHEEMVEYVSHHVFSGMNMNGNINMGGHKISNMAEPEQGSDAATRNFVEQHTIDGNTYVAVDYNGDGNIVLKPYVADEDELTFKSHLTNKQNPHGVTAAQTGALPLSGGTMTGDIDFGNTSHELSWTTDDGTIINLRPYVPTNVFQVTMQNPKTGVEEFGALSLHTNGNVEFEGPLFAKRIVLKEGLSYGTEAQMQALENPVKGQLFFVEV